MKIILLGSIAGGKTTIAKGIIKNYLDIEYLSIDNLRKRFGDYSIAGELTARSEFIKSIRNNADQLIEASGCGELGKNLLERLTHCKEDKLIIGVYVPIELIYERIKERVWDTPFPGRQTNLDNTIAYINKQIRLGEIYCDWAELYKSTYIFVENINSKTQNYINKEIISFIKMRGKKK